MNKGSPWYCKFEDNEDIRENLKERLRDVRANLNEYLFEFTRTYLEEKLRPSYEEFLSSPESKEMHKVLKSGEMFEWILS